MGIQTIGRNGGDMAYIMDKPEFTTVWCPEVGFETARDGFCASCGSSNHGSE